MRWFLHRAGRPTDVPREDLAWGHVGLRVAHSLIPNTTNRVISRFRVFAASILVLMAMAGAGSAGVVLEIEFAV
ncbi:MAG: MAPEG family protein [Rhizomicrobium sp.]